MIYKIYNILSKSQRYKIGLLFLVSLPLIFLETISLGSLPIYILTIINPTSIIEFFNSDYLTNLLNNMTIEQRAFNGLVFIVIIFILKAIYTFFYNFYELSILKKINLEHANKLYFYYLKQKIIFFTQNNPSKLIQDIDDVKRSSSVIFSVFGILKEILIILMIVLMLVFTSVKILLITLSIFLLPIIFFLTFFKKNIKIRGEIAKKYRNLRLKNLQESFSLMKFIKVIRGEKLSLKTFNQNHYRAVQQDIMITFISRLPRIILETFSVIAISIIVYFLFKTSLSFESILPTLTLLVVALLRFIPSLGSILVAINSYKFNQVTLDKLYKIFKNINNNIEPEIQKINNSYKNKLEFNKNIEFDNVSFAYEGSNKKILENINLVIKKNQKIGITGPSGSGKSTLLTIILGLIEPNLGIVQCDGQNIFKNLQIWHQKIGYVPQSIHLLDDSIRNNICYGVNKKEINEKNLENAVEISEIGKFINEMPNKMDTWIGHDGARISGGQLQRIGIARAMYLNPSILILDEPTSSLDKENEEKIINSLFSISNMTIILISHNLKILEKCDQVLNLENHFIKNLNNC